MSLKFREPFEIMDDRYDFLYQEQERKSWLSNEMHFFKSEALVRLNKVVHPQYAEEFAQILSFGHFEDMPEAKKIAETCNLENLHFLAIAELDKEFEKEVMENALFDF